MNVLWITPNILPAPSEALNMQVPFAGGWLHGLAEQIACSGSINLFVATVYQGAKLRFFDIEGIRYYLLPRSNSLDQKSLEPYWEKICTEVSPDLIHIHGTEYSFGLSCMRACPNSNYVVSIQGLIGACARYYFGGIEKEEFFKVITLQRFLKRNTVLNQKKNFKKRGEFEQEVLKVTKHVIGRTSWDYAHVKAINKNVNYHFCNETLRKPFYNAKKWTIEDKNNYTIFISQANYPLKGLHQLLKAICLLKADFPGIKLRIAGHSIIKKDTLMQRIKISEYGVYISQLIKKLDLYQNILFTGILSATQMITEYQNAHIFVCPSCIENSPNSLGEAQLIGVPCVASYVGGIPDMIDHRKSGLLYRFEEEEMLAECIRSIFINDIFAKALSDHGIIEASKRHDPSVNLKTTMAIYQTLCRRES